MEEFLKSPKFLLTFRLNSKLPPPLIRQIIKLLYLLEIFMHEGQSYTINSNGRKVLLYSWHKNVIWELYPYKIMKYDNHYLLCMENDIYCTTQFADELFVAKNITKISKDGDYICFIGDRKYIRFLSISMPLNVSMSQFTACKSKKDMDNLDIQFSKGTKH